MTQRQSGTTTVFLCHSSRDKSFVEKLANDLNNAGIGVWFDKWEIRVGDSIIDKINEGIGNGDYLAIVLSTASVASPWVNRELNAGLMRELQERSVFVLPILLETCNIPPLISDKMYADFSADYDNGLDDLMARFQESFSEAKLGFEELELTDLSHGRAKRYSANILVSPDAPKPLIREIVYRATHAFRKRTYYSNELRKQRFGTQPADVVWLYVYQRLEDIQMVNWICRSSWISPSYSDAPPTLHVDPYENYKDVRIQFRSDRLDWERSTKEDFFPFAKQIVADTEHSVEGARPLIISLTAETAEDTDVIQQMRYYGKEVRDLYFRWNQRSMPPIELETVSNAISGLMAFADNMFVPFDHQGLNVWRSENRARLAQDALRHYDEELVTVRVLLKLIR